MVFEKNNQKRGWKREEKKKKINLIIDFIIWYALT